MHYVVISSITEYISSKAASEEGKNAEENNRSKRKHKTKIIVYNQGWMNGVPRASLKPKMQAHTRQKRARDLNRLPWGRIGKQ